MKTFTIENETSNITAHRTAQEAKSAAGGERFATAAALAGLAAHWPPARLVEIWNSLPGVTPVKKFKDRATAVSRIWKAIQNLGETAEAIHQPELIPAIDTAPVAAQAALESEAVPATPVAPHAPHVAPAELPAKTSASRAKKVPVACAGGPREGSKTSQVIAMLKRDGGTTLEEIMAAMQWQKHTTRAMLSAGGSLTKKHGLVVTSEKVGDQRIYFIKV